MNPGSPEAVEKGCTCPVMDNGGGRGSYQDESGAWLHWVNMTCPIHGTEANPIYKQLKDIVAGKAE